MLNLLLLLLLFNTIHKVLDLMFVFVFHQFPSEGVVRG